MTDILLHLKIWFHFSLHAALLVFVCLVISQVYFHELGHLWAGKACGLPGGAIRFSRVKNNQSRMWFPHCEFEDDEAYLRLPVNCRRFIAAGGVLMDGLTTLLIMASYFTLTNSESLKLALLAACVLKIATITLNILPVERFKNDGWRILNPNAL